MDRSMQKPLYPTIFTNINEDEVSPLTLLLFSTCLGRVTCFGNSLEMIVRCVIVST